MADRHLSDLENALNRAHWVISERLPGNDYEISGYWVICRPDGSHQRTLVFDGLDDMDTLPLDKAYSCSVLSTKGTSLYFSRGPSWKSELRDFVSVLESTPSC